jgi:hypothetical protein
MEMKLWGCSNGGGGGTLKRRKKRYIYPLPPT